MSANVAGHAVEGNQIALAACGSRCLPPAMNWQELYEAGETPWDKGAPSPGLLDRLAQCPLRGRVLIPGCGTGSDVAAIAEAGADEAVGLDIAPSAVAAARARLAGIPNARVQEGDLFRECRGALAGSFDWVWEHTCFCAIPVARRADWVDAVAAALRPGGHLLAVFYLNPWDPGEDPAQGPPFGTSELELASLLASHFTLLESWRPARAYPGREGRELMQLHRRRPPADP